MVDRRIVLTAIAGLLAAPLAIEAQQAGKVYRIGGLLSDTSERSLPLMKAFEGGLREPIPG